MLKKHIDMVLIGKNYLSALLSLDLLSQGQEVLILDDERMSIDAPYIERFYSLEKEYLKIGGMNKSLTIIKCG